MKCVSRNTVHTRHNTALPRRPILPAAASSGLWRKSRRRQQRAVFCTTSVGEKQPVADFLSGSQEEAAPASEVFNWDKCWYPVAVLRDLEPKKPTPVKLLGRDFVLWRDVNKEWKCFADVCPHRLAPLSEGRIEPSDGSLMCSYHGWRFQSDGECTRIPQARDGGVSSGCKNPRSRAKAFPVKVERELVWLWPDESPSAFVESSMKELDGKDYYKDEQYLIPPPYKREMAFPVDFLLENLLDPAHVPFSHHNGLGMSRDDVRGYDGQKQKPTNKKGMEFLFTSHTEINGTQMSNELIITFDPPTLVTFKLGYLGTDLVIHSTPVSSATSLVFFQMIPSRKLIPRLRIFILSVVLHPWIDHLLHNWVFDGDMVFLNGQARRMRRAEAAGKEWDSQYFLPVSCDIGIVALRRWLNGKIGGGGPKLPSGARLLDGNLGEENRRAMLDRYNSHTKNCRSCLRLLRIAHIVKAMSYAASAAFAACSLVLARGLMIGGASSLWRYIGTVLGLILSSFMAHKSSELEQKLTYVDFEHWKT